LNLAFTDREPVGLVSIFERFSPRQDATTTTKAEAAVISLSVRRNITTATSRLLSTRCAPCGFTVHHLSTPIAAAARLRNRL